MTIDLCTYWTRAATQILVKGVVRRGRITLPTGLPELLFPDSAIFLPPSSGAGEVSSWPLITSIHTAELANSELDVVKLHL